MSLASGAVLSISEPLMVIKIRPLTPSRKMMKGVGQQILTDQASMLKQMTGMRKHQLKLNKSWTSSMQAAGLAT